jgi:hypothetical protein
MKMNEFPKNDNYRLDPFKLKRKILDLYPYNSVVRKKIQAEAKLQELADLTNTLNSIPVDVQEDLLKVTKFEIRVHTLLGLFALFVLGYSGYILFATSRFVDTFLFSFSTILCIGIVSYCTIKIYSVHKTISNFNKARDEIKQQIQKLLNS